MPKRNWQKHQMNEIVNPMLYVCKSFFIKFSFICMIWYNFCRQDGHVLMTYWFKQISVYAKAYLSIQTYILYGIILEFQNHVWCWIKDCFLKVRNQQINALSYSPFLIWPLHLNKNNPKNLCSYFSFSSYAHIMISAYLYICEITNNKNK